MYLCNNGIDDDDAKVLAAGLCENKTLNLIDLSANGIGEEGAIALADMLRINNSLTFIDLNCNRLEDKGAETLVQALHVNHKILSLEFDYICLSGQHNNIWQETYELTQRNVFLLWKNQHAVLLDMCIAMQPFDLPAYVLLWIYDQYGPGEAKINQFKKISLIESFKESVQRLKNHKHRKR